MFIEKQSLPEVPKLPTDIYEIMGEGNIYLLLERFYQKLSSSSIRHLFKGDPLESSRRSAIFFIQIFGGPPLYSEKRGKPMMRRRHMNFAIDESARKTWVEIFHQTLDENQVELNFPENRIGIFKKYLESFSYWMVSS